MRTVLYAALGLALAALQPAVAENIAAGAAAIVLECLPYLVASALTAPLLRARAPRFFAYAGCGCGDGPSARSIPAAIATAWIFGPGIALGRIVVATFVARRPVQSGHAHDATLAGALASLAPSALLAATAASIASAANISALPLFVQLFAGLALGVCTSPCAVGGVALAASLQRASPVAAYAVLASAGLFDVRRWLPHGTSNGHDSVAYALMAIAAAIAAYDGGAQLVNPRLTLVLYACAPCLAIWCYHARGSTNIPARALAVALVAAVVIGAPSPSYRATETTLSDIFAGESIEFTGRYLRTGQRAFIERYAITCCRADAEPIVLELASPLRIREATWVDAKGAIAILNGRTVLHVDRFRPMTPPSDPFIYR